MNRVRDGFFLLRLDLHRERNGLSVGFFEGIRVLGDVPVVPTVKVFYDLDFDGHLLVVAQLDFEGFIGPMVVVADIETHPFALAHKVEGAAGGDPDGFILGGVIDVVLADEFQLPVSVAPIEAQAAFGQRHAQMIGFRIYKFMPDPDLFIGLRAIVALLADHFGIPAAVLVWIDLGSVIDIDGLAGDAGGVDEFNLLGFTIAQGGFTIEGVKVVFIKGFFGDRRLRGHAAYACGKSVTSNKGTVRLDFIHIAGHELDFGVVEGFAAFIIHGHPADEINGIAFLGQHEIVIGFPRETAGNVADFGVEIGGGGGLNDPVEGGFEDRIDAEIGEQRLARQAEPELAVHLDNRLAGLGWVHLGLLIFIAEGLHRVVMRDIAAANDFTMNDFIGRFSSGIGLEKLDGFAFAQGEQQILGDWVVAVILLQDLKGRLAGGIAENDRVRLEMRRGAGVVNLIFAGAQGERDRIAHNSKVLVING